MMVGLSKALREWVDRDWERRSYIPAFAFAQKLLFLSPTLLLGAISLVIDIPREAQPTTGAPDSLKACLRS